MLSVQKNDYVILSQGTQRFSLAYILDEKAKRAVLNETLHTDSPKTITYEDGDLIAVLGPTPRHGKIYGVSVTPYIKTVENETFGPIHFFRELEKVEKKTLYRALKDVYAMYKEKTSVDFLPLTEIRILPKSGKMTGCYIAKTRDGAVSDSIHLMPETFSDYSHNVYVIAHEFAHGLWTRCVPLNYRAKWLSLYQKRLHLSKVGADKLKALLNDLLSERQDVLSDYVREIIHGEDGLIIKEVFSYIKRHYRVTLRELDYLIEYNPDALTDMWPESSAFSEPFVDVSQYAMKSVDEFFAESVAFHLAGFTLPKDIIKAIEKTFKVSRASGSEL